MPAQSYNRSRPEDRFLFRTLRPSMRGIGFPCKKILRCGKLFTLMFVMILVWALREISRKESVSWHVPQNFDTLKETFNWADHAPRERHVTPPPTINILVHFVNSEKKPAFIGNFHNMTQSLLSRLVFLFSC